MQIHIRDPLDLGATIRAARKAQSLRQDDAAAAMGLSEGLMVRAENTPAAVQLGNLMEVFRGLGIRLILDTVDVDAESFQKERAAIDKRKLRREEVSPRSADEDPA